MLVVADVRANSIGMKDMRRITSLLLVAIFVSLAVTGLWMAFAHHEPRPSPQSVTAQVSPESHVADANAARRSPPFFPKGLHEWAGYATLIAVPLHLVFNGSTLLNHCSFRRRKTA
jgi:hypothetical protein